MTVPNVQQVAQPAPGQTSPTERGWRRLLPALALFLFVPAVPQLRAVLPIEQTMMLLLAALAACSWVAWRNGGRIWFALAWTAAAIWVMMSPMAGSSAYGAFARGWALMLATGFAAVGLFRHGQTFIGRAITSIALAGIAFGGLLALNGATGQKVGRVISGELSDRVESSIQGIRMRLATPEWQQLTQSNPDAAKAIEQLMDGTQEQLDAIRPVGELLFPALLAFESLMALGLAWSLHHRLSRTRLGPPLAQLREFRFEDQSIWGVIIGLALVLIPKFAAAKTIGWSLLAFFGALYLVRGLGVMTWFLVFPGRWLGIAVVAIVTITWPLWSFPLGIGLSDTYFDWRRRARPSNQGAGND